jgi:hypothetical protein
LKNFYKVTQRKYEKVMEEIVYCCYNVIDRQGISVLHDQYRTQKNKEFMLMTEFVKNLCSNNCDYFKSYFFFYTDDKNFDPYSTKYQ